MGSAMLGFMLLPTLLLLPLTSSSSSFLSPFTLLLLPLALSDDHIAPGKTLLIETKDEPTAKAQNDENHIEENKVTVQHISKNGNGNDYSLTGNKKAGEKGICAEPAMHGAPCTLGERRMFPGRCCAGSCKHLKNWMSEGCPLAEGEGRWKPWPYNGGAKQHWRSEHTIEKLDVERKLPIAKGP